MITKKIKTNCAAASVLLALGFSSMGQAAPSAEEAAKFIPIQNNGRVKSFEAFCNQTVETITGRESWNKKPATRLILEGLVRRESFKDQKWVRVDFGPLRQFLGLPKDRNFFSYGEVTSSVTPLESLMRQAQEKRDKDLPPLKIEQAAETLYTKMLAVKHLTLGDVIKVIPPAEGEVWQSPYEVSGPTSDEFKKIIQAYGEKKYPEFGSLTRTWTAKTGQSTLGKFKAAIRQEVLYTDLRPFEWSWILYLSAFLILSLFKKNRAILYLGFTFLGLALGFHSAGLLLRVLILRRPPVSNMYESMVFMNWALMAFALAFSLIRKNTVFLTVGSAISALVMIYGNLLPIDSNLEVLVPVLRSNYWLTLHVLTIVASYGAFALAMGLGHRHLILRILKKLPKDAEEASGALTYRVIELGVLLLGIGTVLGGVWANESWGRFWGWDPKETWALITFLGYLVIVHLKHSKLIDNFWLAVSSILGFFFVLMTWYGVNFVLGRGLHSYGFGSGGVLWIIYYLVLEIGFLAVVTLTY